MAMEAKMEVSFLEKLGDKLAGFAEGVVGVITRMVGSSNERQMKALGYLRGTSAEKPYSIVPGSLLARINSFEERMSALTDAELKEQTDKFRRRLQDGESLDALLPEAFAACREAGKRAKKMRHYDVQMLGGIVLHRGNIAEMVTGEGKTLVATLPAYLNAITRKGVHVVTVNDYLARRDCEWMLPIYQALGISAGYIQSDMDSGLRRRAYDCDITYGTNSEFGFDYLRDNMKPASWTDSRYPPQYRQCQRPLNYAIIDEVDNILIDEARTPLIISGPAYTDVKRYDIANKVAVQLTQLQQAEGEGTYYEVKEKEHTCHLTEAGIRKAEELVGVESFFTPGNMEWPHLMDNALKAHHLYHKDKRYMIAPDRDNPREKAIVIIDEFTGRAMPGRQWSDGLHQAIEAKHGKDGVRIKQETQTLATITLQNYFKMYNKLAGMTGTAMTEANEFWKIYKLDVIAIPTNKFLQRINSPDLVYRSEQEKWAAVVDEVVEVHGQGRPILIGTTDVAKSEKLSAMLDRKGVKHELLNAKPERVAREAEIVAQAGRRGAVTIATNMAGRGTDIILGGNPETLAWAELKNKTDADGRPLYPTRLEVPEDVWKQTVDRIAVEVNWQTEHDNIVENGGLHIIGTERHESRRIDNQLRGRAGRQGDPGSSRFFVSLSDDLMRIFGGERVARILGALGMTEGEAIESKMVSRQIEKAQKKVEEMHFDQRKNLLEYDEVMDHQRKRMYGTRQEILEGKNCKIMLLDMISEQIDEAVERFLDNDYGTDTFAAFASGKLGVEFEGAEFRNVPFEEAINIAHDKAVRQVPTVIQEGMDENLSEDEDPKEWKWQAMANLMNARYGLKLNDRDLKKIGRENLGEYLLGEAEESIRETDLSDGRPYLDSDWGLKSLADWLRTKFSLNVPVAELTDKDAPELRQTILARVRALYREREVQFPVLAGMGEYMPERGRAAGAQRSDRDGLLMWAKMRFTGQAESINEEEFRTGTRSKCAEALSAVSRKYYPEAGQDGIDAKLDEEFAGTKSAEREDAESITAWFKEHYGIEVSPDDLAGATLAQARDRLWNAFDRRYRPEMSSMERSLLLHHLDASWKTHLLTMDHLRAGIGLMGYAQIDPKTEYKRQGMKEFDQMWEAMQDRITDSVFRVEEASDPSEFMGAFWANATAEHAQAASISTMAQQAGDQANANQGGSDKKAEPIRRTGSKVGRNDPCPCGSGKKYKNCHMRLEQKVG